MLLYQMLAFSHVNMENYKKVICKKFKRPALTWNDKSELLDGSYSVSDIPDYFEYIIKKQETVTDNSPIRIYVNKIENRITVKVKTGYSLELLMKLLGSTKSKITKDKNGENIPYLGITDVVLVHCNIVNNDYQHDSIVLDIFVPNKSLGQFIHVSPKKLIFSKTFNQDLSYVELWFTDQNSKPIEIEKIK